MKISTLPVAALAFAMTGLPVAAALPERSDRVVGYVLEAALDPETHTVAGREKVSWRNTSPDAVGELRLHLYLNAFKNERTTFMKESSGSHRGYRLRDGGWGYIDIESLALADGRDLLAAAEFVRPDDGNPDDETVLRVPLPDPVPPGGVVVFEATFTARLPRVFARTGWKGNFHFVAQWFPKLGVYEPAGTRGRPEGGWNCHQFHANSEFYADFGSYDVTLKVPSDHVIGATGSLAEPPRTEGTTTTYRFVQEDVHDFAWTADPDFIKVERTFAWAAERDPDEERRMARILGLDGSAIPPAGAADLSGIPEPLRLGDVQVTLLIHPEHRAQIDRHFRAAFNGLRYFGLWYGRYPYATLTVVDPAYGGRGAGGMEYPTLITAGTSWVAPEERLQPEGVTIHEFGHQYWYGLVASNEFEEAWLDEGFNTYSTGKVLDRAYGPNRDTIDIAGIPFVRFPLAEIPRDPAPPADGGSRKGGGADRFFYLRWLGASNDSLLNAFRDLPFLTFPADVPIPEPWARRSRYLRQGPATDELLRHAWSFDSRETYAINAYDKPAILLQTLETILGSDAVAKALRLYHERWRFRHPSTDDFISVVNEVAGKDMAWYFDQTVRGSGLLDYAVTGLSSRSEAAPAGVFGPPSSRKTVSMAEARAAEPGARRESEVVVRRLGEVRIPVTVTLEFEGGITETHDWDGAYRWTRIRRTGPERLVAARIGPPEGRALDANWSNDARTAEARRWPALRWWTRLVGWAQNVLFFYAGIA